MLILSSGPYPDRVRIQVAYGTQIAEDFAEFTANYEPCDT